MTTIKVPDLGRLLHDIDMLHCEAILRAYPLRLDEEMPPTTRVYWGGNIPKIGTPIPVMGEVVGYKIQSHQCFMRGVER